MVFVHIPSTMKKLNGLRAQWAEYGRMIKFSHTIFALPFALAAVVLAHQTHPISAGTLIWIVLAMVGARSAAMGFNRIADAELDRINPRTAAREIPSGRLSKGAAWRFVILSALLFIVSAAMLGRVCFYFSFPVLGLLLGYSYTKRFTVFCHVYLGFVISLAPLGAWIALTGSFSWAIGLLSLALMTYIAGFDILYACQDLEFDRQAGLNSLPVYLGVKRALILSSLLHLTSVFCLLLLSPAFGLGGIYLASVGGIAVLYIVEHRLVKPDDLSRINIAFFHMNSMISVLLFIGILLDTLLR